jgi:hypothetical protein
MATANSTTTADPLDIEPRREPGEPPPEVKRDRWGRYLLPDPTSGKLQAWTRATTFAKSASDTFALAQWQSRTVAKGMSMRPDLYALAAATHPDDKETLNRIAEQAKEAGGGSKAASIGTALHAFTEQEDRGEKPVVPEPWTDNVALYNKCLVQHQLTIDPNFIEAVVLVPEFGVAGTLDRLGNLPEVPVLRVVDLKTGKDLSYGWMEIAVQLFLYSRASHWYDVATQTLHEMPSVDQKIGNVIHLPVNQKTVALYEVDLELGATVASHIAPIRELRKRKDYAKLVSPPIEAIAPSDLIKAVPDPEWDEPESESAKITKSVTEGNAADKAVKSGVKFAVEKVGKLWGIRNTEVDRLVLGDDGEPQLFKLKRDAVARIKVLSDPKLIGQQAAEDLAKMKKDEEWPEDEPAPSTAVDKPVQGETETGEKKDPWMARIFEATSYRELQKLYVAGDEAGTWNERHTKAAAMRKAELEEMANAPAAADETVELSDDNW